jgi:long-chain acyl-CoA synthetase
VQEYSSPAAFEIPAGAALPDAVTAHAAATPDHVAFSRTVAGGWAPVTSGEFAEQVSALARGMIAAGVQAGDRVGILSRTRYEWTLADYAIWTAGGVGVPLYETSSAEQAQWILSDSGAVAVVVETATHQAMAPARWSSARCRTASGCPSPRSASTSPS